jgi:hypothetical protein
MTTFGLVAEVNESARESPRPLQVPALDSRMKFWVVAGI